MNYQSLLISSLENWSISTHVTLYWSSKTLVFEKKNGNVTALANFPSGFWKKFNNINAYRSKKALGLIKEQILSEYEFAENKYTKFIEISANTFSRAKTITPRILA